MTKVRAEFPLWMTATTAAEYLDFSQCKHPRIAFVCFARRKGIEPRGHRGRIPLYHRNDLDRAVTVIEGDVS